MFTGHQLLVIRLVPSQRGLWRARAQIRRVRAVQSIRFHGPVQGMLLYNSFHAYSGEVFYFPDMSFPAPVMIPDQKTSSKYVKSLFTWTSQPLFFPNCASLFNFPSIVNCKYASLEHEVVIETGGSGVLSLPGEIKGKIKTADSLLRTGQLPHCPRSWLLEAQ